MSTVGSATDSASSVSSSLTLLSYLSESSSSSSSNSLIDYLTSSSDDSSSDSSSVSITEGLSLMASLISSIDNLSSDQKKELKDLLKKAQEEMSGSSYDPEELADSASDDLKAALKDQEIGLDEILSSYNSLYEASKGISATSDYTSLLSASSNGKLYSLVNTLLDRQLADAEIDA